MDKRFKQFSTGIPEKVDINGGDCIIYNRMNSKEQIDGQSLETQLVICQKFAEKNNFIILNEFGGTFESATSDIERKEFQKMLNYIRSSKKKIDAVIVYSMSRFSRTGSTSIIEEIEKYGACTLSATSGYNPKLPSGKFMQGIELASARYDNDIKRMVTIENTTMALKKGRWVNKAPRGYDQKTTKKEQIITINDEGEKIKQAFEWKANQNFSNEEIRRKLQLVGFEISKQKLSEMFKNVFYCGMMSHKLLNGEVVKGNHPPMCISV